MAVNKNNPLRRQARAMATLHPATPNFLWHQAAQGAGPRLPSPVSRPAYTTTLLLAPSLLPRPAPRLQESPGRRQVYLPAYVIQFSWKGGKTPKHNQDWAYAQKFWCACVTAVILHYTKCLMNTPGPAILGENQPFLSSQQPSLTGRDKRDADYVFLWRCH